MLTADGMAARTASGWRKPSSGSRCTAPAMDSFRRAAALPVGAARRMRKGRPPLSSARLCSKASSLTTVVVLPVPGPPVTMLKALRAAKAQASFCQSTPAATGAAGNKLSSAWRSAACGSGVLRASRWSMAARTSRSYCQ